MPDDLTRSERTVALPNHLWETLELMASEMGSSEESLLSQAVFQFARGNGYLAPGHVRASMAPPPAAKAAAPAAQRSLSATPPPPPLPDEPSVKPRGSSRAMPAFGAPAQAAPASVPRHEEPLPEAPSSGEKVLVIFADGREVERVDKPRFLIGRGKHCDLIINSGKVSREHAAIVREGGHWFIEDLGSSNGTWFEKRRITRREIQDGDEYFICAEKIACTFRE